MDLFLLTAGLGSLSVVISKKLTGRSFTPCTWYWIAWLIAIPSAEFIGWSELGPPIGPLASDAITWGHVGAFIGFAMGSLLARGPSRRSHFFVPISELPWHLSDRLVRMALIVEFVGGIIYLVYRLSIVGFSPGLLVDLRTTYTDNWGLVDHMANYLLIALSPLVPLVAAEDALTNVRVRRLLAIILSGMPIGLAMGTRGWMLFPVITYVLTYSLVSPGDRVRPAVWGILKKLSPYVVLVIVLFLAIAILRSDDPATTLDRQAELLWSQRTDSIGHFIFYMGAAVSASDLNLEFAKSSPPAYGQLLFPWFATQLGRIGLITDVSGSQLLWRKLIYPIDYRIWAVQATILPLIVGDFGWDGIIPVMAALMGICQVLSLRWAGRGVVRHYIASTLVVAAFLTMQDGGFGIAANVVGVAAALGWSALLAYSSKKNRSMRRLETTYSPVSRDKPGLSAAG